MAVLDFFQDFSFQPQDFSFQLSDDVRRSLIFLAIRLGVLGLCIGAALIVGRCTPWLVRFILNRTSGSSKRVKEFASISKAVERPLTIATVLILISVSLNIIKTYSGLHSVISFVVDAAVTVSLAWMATRIVKVLIRLYGVSMLGRINDEVNDIVLIIESIANFLIGFFAITIFAQTRNFNFLALLTGLGIGAAGIAFAAQEALGQLIGTVVIYLDRPYMAGEYIRANFNIHAEDIYGRVESIGIRSTKIRLAVSNTLLIVPNSLMSSMDIENISRGTKVMVLLYVDFSQNLDETVKALVSQTIKKSFDAIFGIDPGSTRIHLFNPEERGGTRARVSFFVMGSSESSVNLRKRMLEIASQSLKRELQDHNLEFSMQEPTVYVDSPVTL
ncbi:MAG: mechanosensitive ion channel domain-containing protein [Elainellaceae cyanobacterium]